ncbi:wiskott-Aldrich syndrome protein homolog 1, partial [Hyalella azteca]|uniref:Wiskott-Aldrich syndrome protein homolog 1 n=1 Tax=Hyalella azteca TaxID=294128 RepID=A0A8B7N465_HYAAZ
MADPELDDFREFFEFSPQPPKEHVNRYTLAHDITVDSPSPTESPESPDSPNDDDRLPSVIDDNKCCTDADFSCPHLPRAAPPVPPVFPPSPEIENIPNPLCGAPSPRHKPALRSGNSSVTSSPKRKVDFQGSPSKLVTPKKPKNNISPSRSISQKNSTNNNQRLRPPTHKLLSNASNNNNLNNSSNASPIASPRRLRQLSVGEEIVDVFVRSCGSPICGSPRPRPAGSLQTSPVESLDSFECVENDDEYEEDDGVNFELGCSLEDEDGYEVDEILTVEVEENFPEVEQNQPVKSKETHSGENLTGSQVTESGTEQEKSSKDEKEVEKQDCDGELDAVSDLDCLDADKDGKDEVPSSADRDNSNTLSPQPAAGRRRRLLPEIPKNKK